MELRLRTRGLDPGREVLDQIRSAVRLELGRYASRISSTRISLTSESASADGAAVSCQIRVRLQEGTLVVVEERGQGCADTARRAANRLARRLYRDPRMVGGRSASERPAGIKGARG